MRLHCVFHVLALATGAWSSVVDIRCLQHSGSYNTLWPHFLFGALGQPSAEMANPSGKATSVTVLLSQALRSNDHQLLEKCFAISNDRVMKSTVRQLAPQDAARLLQVAVQRLQSSPHRGKQIAAWLRALLLYHTAYLISAPGLCTVFLGFQSCSLLPPMHCMYCHSALHKNQFCNPNGLMRPWCYCSQRETLA